MYSTNINCMPPYTRCALRVGRLETCSKEVGVRCCRSAGIVTSCVNIAKVAEFLQTRFRIDLKSAVTQISNKFVLFLYVAKTKGNPCFCLPVIVLLCPRTEVRWLPLGTIPVFPTDPSQLLLILRVPAGMAPQKAAGVWATNSCARQRGELHSFLPVYIWLSKSLTVLQVRPP